MILLITLTITLLGSILALVLRPGAVIGVIFMANIFWPTYLRIPMGIAQMSAPRIIAFVLLIRLLIKPHDKGIKFNWVDVLVVAGAIWQFAANISLGANQSLFVYLIGLSLDTVLMYFVTRLSLKKVSDFKALIVPLALCGIFLGPIGLLETFNIWSPYEMLRAYDEFSWQLSDSGRLGLTRAMASGSQFIFWGLTMLIVTGFLWSLRTLAEEEGTNKRSWIWLAGLIGGILGVFSSVSSAPIGGLLLFVVINGFYWARPLIKSAIWSLVWLGVAFEIFSNRHFYHLITYVGLNGATAWYRTRLMEVAVQRLPEYWLFGFGGVTPDHWGRLIDGRKIVDPVNNYLIVAISSGLLGAIILLLIQIIVLNKIIKLWKYGPEKLRKYAFTQGCLLLVLMLSSMSTGFFSVVLTLTYIFYGSIPNVKNRDIPGKSKSNQKIKGITSLSG